jgi:hypothetical protein
MPQGGTEKQARNLCEKETGSCAASGKEMASGITPKRNLAYKYITCYFVLNSNTQENIEVITTTH